ncbi:DUF551 domain-containing protein [Enterobacter soli]|uniref:DUF551 domain-containing protein n=1 Tax=Enterobacter soli TaxID=885040 RepID=UPI0028965935|nr:DUF551 domain-containing protein [Enterobacter soli]
MSTITRELAKLFRKITNSEIDAEGNAHVVLSPDDSLLINNARIALASLEAEAVAWDYERASCITSEGPQGFKRVIEHEYPPEWAIEEGRARKIVPLFTAPPVPVSVPGDITAEDCPAFIKYDLTEVDEAWARGFNACRAAMLQGAQPVERLGAEFEEALAELIDSEMEPVTTAYKLNSPVIPYGWVACSERMPGHSKTFLALTAFGEYWTGYFDRTGVFWCDETKVENVTHWMPLPAAPQQEVK